MYQSLLWCSLPSGSLVMIFRDTCSYNCTKQSTSVRAEHTLVGPNTTGLPGERVLCYGPSCDCLSPVHVTAVLARVRLLTLSFSAKTADGEQRDARIQLKGKERDEPWLTSGQRSTWCPHLITAALFTSHNFYFLLLLLATPSTTDCGA
jgi:hypothetical protein